MEQKSVVIRGLEIGRGTPKVCVPVMGGTLEELRKEAERAAAEKPDLIEWRADYYEEILKPGKAREALRVLSEVLFPCPLLFTFRTAGEGGMRQAAPDRYEALLLEAASGEGADLIDVEIRMEGLDAGALIGKLHACGKPVIASNHHFHETPAREELLAVFAKMREDGADILKMAVMPQNLADVARLLAVTGQMKEETDRPVITMAMGALGAVTRICGETFGSCVTFASAGRASAPGQLAIGDVRTVQEILHRSLAGI